MQKRILIEKKYLFKFRKRKFQELYPKPLRNRQICSKKANFSCLFKSLLRIFFSKLYAPLLLMVFLREQSRPSCHFFHREKIRSLQVQSRQLYLFKGHHTTTHEAYKQGKARLYRALMKRNIDFTCVLSLSCNLADMSRSLALLAKRPNLQLNTKK